MGILTALYLGTKGSPLWCSSTLPHFGWQHASNCVTWPFGQFLSRLYNPNIVLIIRWQKLSSLLSGNRAHITQFYTLGFLNIILILSCASSIPQFLCSLVNTPVELPTLRRVNLICPKMGVISDVPSYPCLNKIRSEENYFLWDNYTV